MSCPRIFLGKLAGLCPIAQSMLDVFGDCLSEMRPVVLLESLLWMKTKGFCYGQLFGLAIEP